MKKFIFIAAVALAAASCAKSYDTAPVVEKDIGFETWSQPLTKARIQGSNNFAAGDDFAVYGFKQTVVGTGESATTTNVVVFDHKDANTGNDYDDSDTNNDITVTASPNGENLKWSYAPPQYWDNNTTRYYFSAVSPASVGTDAQELNPYTGVSKSAPVEFSGSNNDILVANKTEVPHADYGYTVQLNFNHIASLVDFVVRRHSNLAGATLDITAFNVSNIDKKGFFEVTGYSGNAPQIKWTSDGETYATYLIENGVNDGHTLPSNVGSDPETTYYLIKNLIVMPQDFRSTGDHIQTATISYSITESLQTTEFNNVSFNIAKFDDNGDDMVNNGTIGKWEAGKHYIFYITINDNRIEFSADIQPWGETNGYYYLVN